MLNTQNRSGFTPLLSAARIGGSDGVCQVFLELGTDLHVRDKQGCNVLHTLAKRHPYLFSEEEAISLIEQIKRKAPDLLAMTDDNGQTPADLAVQHSHQGRSWGTH